MRLNTVPTSSTSPSPFPPCDPSSPPQTPPKHAPHPAVHIQRNEQRENPRRTERAPKSSAALLDSLASAGQTHVPRKRKRATASWAVRSASPTHGKQVTLKRNQSSIATRKTAHTVAEGYAARPPSADLALSDGSGHATDEMVDGEEEEEEEEEEEDDGGSPMHFENGISAEQSKSAPSSSTGAAAAEEEKIPVWMTHNPTEKTMEFDSVNEAIAYLTCVW